MLQVRYSSDISLAYMLLHAGLKCNVKNVRNFICNVKNTRELGERLKIPSHKLDEIDQLPPANRKLETIGAWFQIIPENCKWDTLRSAVEAVESGQKNGSSHHESGQRNGHSSHESSEVEAHPVIPVRCAVFYVCR